MSATIEATQALVPCPKCGEDLFDYGLVVQSRATTVQNKNLNHDGMLGDYDSYDVDIHGTAAVLCGFCEEQIPTEYEHYDFKSGVYGQAPEIASDLQVEALRAVEV